MKLWAFTFFTVVHAHTFCQNGHEYGPSEVIEWLNKLEYHKNGPRIGPVKNLWNTLKCRKDSEKCAFLQYKEITEVHQHQENQYELLYGNNHSVFGQIDENGYWNGPIQGYEKWFLTMNMTLVANFKHGKLIGSVWRLLEENGFMVSDNLEMDGKNVLYIYPGLFLGLYGHFHQGQMIRAKAVKVTGFVCEQGIMKPSWEYQKGGGIYSFDPATKQSLSSEPLLKDPLEDFWVEIQTSSIKGAGDGVFLKRPAPKNTVVAFFNGIHITLQDTLNNQEMKNSVHKMWNDWESDDMVYIPKNWTPIHAYNASFGHKINHNSDFNVDAGYINHPRFGKIRSIVTTQDLEAGEELFCQYSNTIDGTTFVRQVFKDFSQFMDINEEDKRASFLGKMQEDYTLMLQSMKHDPNKHYWKP